MDRIWTLADANEALPKVTEMLEELAAATDALQEDPSGPVRDPRLAAALQAFHHFGVSLKGLRGPVDFPSRLGDLDVLLCWMPGEPEISSYHPKDGGFSGRQPIPRIDLDVLTG